MEPSAPEPEPVAHIYGEETGCDVVFLAGQDEPNRWRLPAHSAVLKSANLVFNKMFSEPYFSPPKGEGEGQALFTIDVPDVDGRALDNLLRLAAIHSYSSTFHVCKT